MKRIGLGLWGVGYQAEKYLRLLGDHPRIAWRAVAGSPGHEDRARDLAGRAGARAVGADEMLADPAVEVVIIATPSDRHRAEALRALEAGKDLLVEKPLALTSAACEEVARAAARRGRVVSAGFNLRFREPFRWALRRAREGAVGDVFAVRGSYAVDLVASIRAREKPWWLDPSQRPMILTNIGIHLVDLVAEIAGEPGEVATRASTRVIPEMGPDTFSILGRSSSGVTVEAFVTAAARCPQAISLEVYGTDGTIRGGERFDASGKVVERAPDQPVVDLVGEVDDLLDAIEARRPPAAPAEAAARALRWLEACRSAS